MSTSSSANGTCQPAPHSMLPLLTLACVSKHTGSAHRLARGSLHRRQQAATMARGDLSSFALLFSICSFRSALFVIPQMCALHVCGYLALLSSSTHGFSLLFSLFSPSSTLDFSLSLSFSSQQYPWFLSLLSSTRGFSLFSFVSTCKVPRLSLSSLLAAFVLSLPLSLILSCTPTQTSMMDLSHLILCMHFARGDMCML
jgi:hypothetical protein